MQDIKNIISSSIQTKESVLKDEVLLNNISKSIDVIESALKQNNRIWFCGNGGSAADAQHLAAEFSGRFYKNRKALPAEALHCNSSYLTAVANDYGFDVVYSRLLEGIGTKGDVLVAISTSGNSTNIINAIESANKMGITTIGFTGESGGKMKDISNLLINVPSVITPRVQESHILIGHIICEIVESRLF